MDDDFQEGFMFALVVLKGMGVEVDINKLKSQLESVVTGDLTLMPSPEEVIRDKEAHAGQPMPEPDQEMVRQILTNRGWTAKNRQHAASILEAINRWFGI